MSPLESALDYLKRGIAVIPVPHQGKNPGRDGWQRLRLTPESAPNHFNGAPQNIGALLGEPSGWIVDIDLDHKRAVELADDFTGDNITAVVERLLFISGEDPVSIPRKYLPNLEMKLPTRFMFLTNELPKFTDASNALVGRFLILQLTQGFYGREDRSLTQKLLTELPGILNWAIEGWHRLQQRGHFLMPGSAKEIVEELEDLSSPVRAFIRESCNLGPGHRAGVDGLFIAWQDWCVDQGRKHMGTKQSFGKDLTAAQLGVVLRRGTDNHRFYEGIALK